MLREHSLKALRTKGTFPVPNRVGKEGKLQVDIDAGLKRLGSACFLQTRGDTRPSGTWWHPTLWICLGERRERVGFPVRLRYSPSTAKGIVCLKRGKGGNPRLPECVDV